MKSLSLHFLVGMILLAMFAPACAAIAATNTPAGAKGVAATNSAPVELAVPLSVFDLTVKPTKDPLFPLSTRQPIATPGTNAPAFSIAEFTLKGLSGSAHTRLALINNRTLADGEETELTTPSGKVKIHCVEVKENSVVIRVGGQRETMELFLRKAAQ